MDLQSKFWLQMALGLLIYVAKFGYISFLVWSIYVAKNGYINITVLLICVAEFCYIVVFSDWFT